MTYQPKTGAPCTCKPGVCPGVRAPGHDDHSAFLFPRPKCQGFEFEDAGAVAFGITQNDAEHLFSSTQALERTLEEEVQVLRDFVAQQWDAGCALEP